MTKKNIRSQILALMTLEGNLSRAETIEMIEVHANMAEGGALNVRQYIKHYHLKPDIESLSDAELFDTAEYARKIALIAVKARECSLHEDFIGNETETEPDKKVVWLKSRSE